MRKLFGTNGIRGVVGKDMGPELALGIGRAAGTYFKGEFAVGRDTRTSGKLLIDSVVSGISAVGCDVTDVGVVPTPCLQNYVRMRKLSAGVIITASHNPPEYNGIKCVDSLGMECSSDDEEAIEAIYFDKRYDSAAWDAVGKIQISNDALRPYIDSIVSKINRERILHRKLKAVLDCGNGAGGLTSPFIVGNLGCELITLNAQPDGHFPGRLPEPTSDNLTELMRIVREVGADIGIAHDGDADRVIFVDEKGGYIHGDKSMALIAKDMLQRKVGLVVTPVSSSSCLEEVVKSSGGEIHYTRVGSPIVARTMYKLGAVFGGEENGGLIFPEHQFCRDGGMAVARMIELLARQDEPLSTLIANLPQYQLFKTAIPHPPELKNPIMEMIKKETAEQKVIDIDGIKILRDEGWVLIRPSGTEPIIRVFSEAREKTTAEKLGHEGVTMVKEAIEKLSSHASHSNIK